MQRLLCVIRDRLAESCGPVMLYAAVPAAIRSFSDVALDPETMVGRHVEDFDLLQIAYVDEGSGEVTPCSPPVVLMTGVAWLAAQRDKATEVGADGQLSLLRKEA
nr:MAG: nonstructural protein [Microvirus sp.]